MKAKNKTKNRINGKYHGNYKHYKFKDKLATDIGKSFAAAIIVSQNKLPKCLNIMTCLETNCKRGLDHRKAVIYNIRTFFRNGIKYLAKTQKHPEVLIVFRQQLRKLKYANEKRFEWRTY